MTSPLTDAAYERLRRHARTHREDLVVRLCGECGLRPAEVTQVTLDSVVDIDGASLLRLPDRTAFVPADVEHDLRKYVGSTDRDASDPVVDVSTRRVQMLVREVADRAADETGEDRFREVSSRGLRERFVVSHLQSGADPRIVAAAAGFDSVAGVAPYLDDPSGVELASALGGGGAESETASPRVRGAVGMLATLATGLGSVETVDDLYARVCDRVVGVDGYESAWVARPTDDGTEVLEHAGLDLGIVAAILDDHARVVEAALQTGTHQLVETGNGDLVVCVPFGTVEGADRLLGVGVSAGSVDEGESDALVALGGLAGRAFDALQRRRLLVADVVTELRFSVQDRDAVLVDLSAGPASRVEVTGVVPGGPGLVVYAVVEGATPRAVSESLADDDRVGRVRYVGDADAGPVVELALSTSPARTLVEFDATIQSYEAESGGATLAATVTTDADVRAIVDGLTAEYPESSLTAKENVERTVDPGAGLQASLRDDLTDRQASVLRAAFHGGYFQWPRESTAEELADSLDVASPTLHNHLRVAQQKLLDAYFEG